MRPTIASIWETLPSTTPHLQAGSASPPGAPELHLRAVHQRRQGFPPPLCSSVTWSTHRPAEAQAPGCRTDGLVRATTSALFASSPVRTSHSPPVTSAPHNNPILHICPPAGVTSQLRSQFSPDSTCNPDSTQPAAVLLARREERVTSLFRMNYLHPARVQNGLRW